jgi:hypothetical protein
MNAVLTSWRVVLANPVPMAVWAALIMLLVLAASPRAAGLVVVVPMLGHASWHAYRDLVDASALAPAGLDPGAPRLMFGFTEEQIAGFGLSFGVGAFMLYMLFIVGQLAWEAKAGKFGTFVIFLGLAFGMVGFVAKYLIQWVLGIH